MSDDDRVSVSSETSKTRSSKGSFRRRLRSLSSSADRISRHSIIDGTKTVSSRIVKKALGRRSSKDIRNIEEETKDDLACQPCEIFESIKFDFPVSRSCSTINLEEAHSSFDEDLQPPSYPPPPIPEQLFDDVFSDQSSNSYSDSQYELLERGGKLGDDDAVDVPFCQRDPSDGHSETFSNSLGNESSFDDDLMDSFNTIFVNFDIHAGNVGNTTTGKNQESFFSSSETGSSSKSVEVHNYENWASQTATIAPSMAYVNWYTHSSDGVENACSSPPPPPSVRSPSPTKSVIIQFDPLYDDPNAEKESSIDDDRASLCEIFSDLRVAGESVYESQSKRDTDTVSCSKLLVGELNKERRGSTKGPSSLSGWSIRRALKAVSDTHWSFSQSKSSTSSLKTNNDCVNKPEICSKLSATLHNGYVYKSASGGEKAKDFARYWCQLSEGKFYYSVEKDGDKESIDLDTIISVHLVNDRRTSNEGENLYCFEITVSTRAQKYVWATLCTSERCVWMQKLFENLTLTFPARLTADYTHAGWCFLKECINGTWMSCWLLLQKRTLIYARDNELVEVDLRKARHVGLQETEDVVIMNDKNNKQTILLDTVSRYLYLIMAKSNDTVEWQRVLKAAAVDNSRDLENQQLTKDDVPVIVDKCINFVYAHGSMSEGIYRRSGSNSSVTKLLSSFRQDSWAVQLSRQEYTEYDVANVLKRFFRDLPEPLFTVQLHKHFCNAPDLECPEEDKLSLYRSILEQLEPINYVTVRKLIGHLYYVQLQREKNLMTAENLAAIWGPTLMHAENSETNQWLNQECKALIDLIVLFPKLFLIDKKEIERENKIREVLEKHHNSYTTIPQSFKPSGDLKVWIYLKSKEDGDHVNITIDPNKTCESVCKELADRVNTQPHLLCLHEVICNDSLSRPMHYKERILDSVLRWGYWDEADRKNNYLLLSTSNIVRDALPLAKAPLTVCNELLFADRKMKSFKNHSVEFSEGTLTCYKDKKSTVRLREWHIDDLIWYVGYEQKRNPRCRWAVTFIDKNEKQIRSKETPFFGYTIAGANKEDRLRWIAALVLGQHPDNDLLMPVSLLN